MSYSTMIECPKIDVEFSRRFELTQDDIPEQISAELQGLLDAIVREVPHLDLITDDFRRRTEDRFQDELNACAKHMNRRWQEIMVANVSYDLVASMFGCSTICFPTPDGPVVARNMDWWPEQRIARSSMLVRYTQPNGQLHFANAAWPGAIGVVTGFSGRGFAVILNSVCSPDELSNPKGYPVLLHLRRVVEDASDFEDALQMLTETTLATSALVTLIGRTNDQRVVIERSPSKFALRRPESEDHPLITTNDYRVLYKPDVNAASSNLLFNTTCQRFEHLRNAFANHRSSQKMTDEIALSALVDENVIQSITAQHILIRPTENLMKLYVPMSLL